MTLTFTKIGEQIDAQGVHTVLEHLILAADIKIQRGKGDDVVPDRGFKWQDRGLVLAVWNEQSSSGLTWLDIRLFSKSLWTFMHEPRPYPGFAEVKFFVSRDSKGRLGTVSFQRIRSQFETVDVPELET